MDNAINIIEEDTNRIKIEFLGLTHTLCNLLRTKLLMDPHVIFVGYNVQHPLTPKPLFTIKTDKQKKVRKALIDALNEIIVEAKTFQDKFRAALAELIE